jgi:hypothetical protein
MKDFIAFEAQSESFMIALPPPIKSAAPQDNRSSACCAVVIPPVNITGMYTACFTGEDTSEKYPVFAEFGLHLK